MNAEYRESAEGGEMEQKAREMTNLFDHRRERIELHSAKPKWLFRSTHSEHGNREALQLGLIVRQQPLQDLNRLYLKAGRPG